MQLQATKSGKRYSSYETSESMSWSQENQVYYYSKFDLFENEKDQEQFYMYSIFLGKVDQQLGHEWRIEASLLFQPYFTCREVFMCLLELWLYHHPTVNSIQQGSSDKSAIFSQSYVNQFFQKMQLKFQEAYPNQILNPPIPSLKAVTMGFFMASNEIWQEMFQPQTPENSIFKLFSANSLFKGVTSTIEKTFKPLMVVTSKISTVFGRKKRKFNAEMEQQVRQHEQEGFENCYHEFRKTLVIQKQLQRKMSDFNLNEQEQSKETNKIIEKKEFDEVDSPIQPNLISSVYNYVTQFINRNPSWQIASNFVTQILDLNQINTEDGMRIKVLRPAEDFYRKLVIAWLLFKKKQEIFTFDKYLERLKFSYFNENWNQKYLIPIKYFYERMNNDWTSIMEECNQQQSPNEKQILRIFLKRVKNSMKNDWDKRIQMNRSKGKKQSVPKVNF